VQPFPGRGGLVDDAQTGRRRSRAAPGDGQLVHVLCRARGTPPGRRCNGTPGASMEARPPPRARADPALVIAPVAPHTQVVEGPATLDDTATAFSNPSPALARTPNPVLARCGSGFDRRAVANSPRPLFPAGGRRLGWLLSPALSASPSLLVSWSSLPLAPRWLRVSSLSAGGIAHPCRPQAHDNRRRAQRQHQRRGRGSSSSSLTVVVDTLPRPNAVPAPIG